MDSKDAKSVDTDLEIETPETRYFKMMMQDNEIGRVELGVDNTDADSIIGGQTIASLMQDGKMASALPAREPSTAESIETNEQSTANDQSTANEQSTLSIVGYDDVSTLANDTVDETTKAFFTGNGSREDSKPRMRLFKEYKTPEKTKKSSSSDEETQPETPPGMIKVRSSHNSNSSHDEEPLSANGKMKTIFLRSRQRVYLVAGGLALILFIAIIALAVALRGVRGSESTGISSSAIESISEDNGLLDFWPDLDPAIGNEEEPSVNEEGPGVNNREPTTKPVNTPLEPRPTLAPTVPPPTLEPTVDETQEIMFAEAANLLDDYGIIKQKDLEKRKDSPMYKSTLWLSQDPNYFEYSEDRLIQRWTLSVIAQYLDPTIEIKNTLRGRKLQVESGLLPGWLTYTDECSWFSVGSTGSPCDENGVYTTLDLQGLMLGGNLPTELGLLSNSLKHILLGGNELTGKIPDAIENLTNLVSLRLRRNNLEGKVQIDFTQLTSLEIFDVGENSLTGSLQYEILDLTSPTEIYLDNNDLSGDIPWNIGNLNTLSTLALEGNDFTGWVPDSLGNIKGLKVLTLGENDFKGELPKDICKLKNLDVLSVDCAVQGCKCCTECATTGAPTASPTFKPTNAPTFLPTASPTTSPTASPTASPTTLSPTVSPTAPPTSSPTVAPLPTSSPTVCIPKIEIDDFCFAPGVDIEIDVSNCDAQDDDWVAIYKVDVVFDRDNLTSNSALWSWACGTQNCQQSVDQLTFSMNEIHTDHVLQWPLTPGLYTAILARNTPEPYEAIAVSDTFVVADEC